MLRDLHRTVRVATLLIIAWASVAATYYIDYDGGSDANAGTSTGTAWKRCPGMVGFSGSYSHSAGDQFVFKGGVTWPSNTLPVTIGYSGATNSQDRYTSSDSWYSGGSWSYPVFDGGNVQSAYSLGLIAAGTRSSLILEKLKVIKVGSLTDGSGTAIMANGNDILIQNCWVEPNSINGFASDGGGGIGGLTIRSNMFRRLGRIHISTDTNTYSGIEIDHNLFPGSPDYNSFAFHTDGIMLGGDGVGTQRLSNVSIHHNKWYGDWSTSATAFIYLNAGLNTNIFGATHVTIYNNIMVTENTNGTPLSPAFIYVIAGQNDVRIYNNTLDARSLSGVGVGILFGYDNSNVSVKNNIISGFTEGVVFDTQTTGTVELDGCLFNVGSGWWIDDLRPGKTAYKTIATAQAAGFGTTYIDNSDPQFTTLPSGGVEGSGVFTLQSTSPAIGNGLTLSAYLTDDYSGTSRTVPWDVGAYEYQQPAITISIGTSTVGTIRSPQ